MHLQEWIGERSELRTLKFESTNMSGNRSVEFYRTVYKNIGLKNLYISNNDFGGEIFRRILG